MAIDPRARHPVLLCRSDVVLEAERDVEDLRRVVRRDQLERAFEVPRGRLVGADVVGSDDVVDRRLDVAQRVLDDVAVGVRHDHEPQPGLVRAP